MSETQPNNTPSDEVQYAGGWKKPEKTGGWRVLEQPREEAQIRSRVLPAMPPELDEAPAQTGAWHLPRPEDTHFGPEDEVEVGTAPAAPIRPEDIVLDQSRSGDTTQVPEDILDEEDTGDLESYSGLGELVASLTTMLDAQPKPDILPGADLEEDTASATTTADESDDFGPALAERDALTKAASGDLTEIHPEDYARQRVDWLASEGEETQTAPEQDTPD
ncbi:MAG: hypothetical protein K8J31_15555, partial [Anaerolineae bacterium]|nr:hypothetical protein [Anaerolineae bacterium]